MDSADSLDSLTAKWRARWPEWVPAMAFVPAAQRESAVAWFALLLELTEAAWGGADPTPGLAKLGWWQEELGGWAKGARRHPLGAVLQARAVPWTTLARALPALQASRARPGEPATGAGLEGFAVAVAACEAALFGAGGPMPDDAGAAVVSQALHGEHLLSHPETAAMAAPAPLAPGAARAATRPRRIHAALVAARLRRPGATLPPWRALLLAWRAARQDAAFRRG